MGDMCGGGCACGMCVFVDACDICGMCDVREVYVECDT